MTRQQVIDAAISTVEEMRSEYVPRDTGNMAFNALEYKIENKVLDISVNPQIAPYVPYTNEPWLAARWNGKSNPNEGWWQKFVEEFTKRLTTKLRGTLK